MPTVIKCKNCGAILAKIDGLPDWNWFIELREQMEFCSRCGRALPKEFRVNKANFEVEANPLYNYR